MRFAMMEKRLPPAEVITFLQSIADALAAFVAQLEGSMAAADFPGQHPRLALYHGLVVYRASLRWAEYAIAALSA
jgi:hypothetical protein